MFTKILIANRGEIACRVAATARRLGVRTVAVHSDADASARHVQACDEAVHIGGNAPRDSYLRGERIIAAALRRWRAGDPSRLRLPQRERRLRPGLRRCGPGVHRPAAGGDPGDGPEGRVQAADGEGRRAAGARLPRGRPGPGPAAARGRSHRLPGAHQGQRRRRRQGHAHRHAGRRVRSGAGLVPARGAQQLRRRRGADRALRAPGRGTSRSRCSPTRTATASTSSSATARCSAATRRCWRRRPRPA